MDFRHTKMLLLIIFLVFDIYLAFLLFSRAPIQSSNGVDAVQTLEVRLKNRNIKLPDSQLDTEMALPVLKTNQSTRLVEQKETLKGQKIRLSDKGLESTFDEPVVLDIEFATEMKPLTDEQMAKIQTQLLGKSEWFIAGESYTQGIYFPHEHQVIVYQEAYDNKVIMDGTAQIRLQLDKENRVKGYLQTYQDVLTTVTEANSLKSVRDVLSYLDTRVDTYIPDGSTIHPLTLVYYRTNNLKKIAIYNPAWVITYGPDEENMKTVMIDALDLTRVVPSVN